MLSQKIRTFLFKSSILLDVTPSMTQIINSDFPRNMKYFSLNITMALLLTLSSMAMASPKNQPTHIRHQSVPILGVTFDKTKRPLGIVMYIMIHFQKRADHGGLKIHFRKVPGRFGPIARKSVATSIGLASKAAKLKDNSWTVILEFPYAGLTMYGDSLSAMIALSVIALAKDDAVKYGRTLTGTILKNGRIGKVTGIPYKIYAAHAAGLKQVLIPDEYHPLDGEWRLPFLMDVSHVGTLEKAYRRLTDQPLFPKN